MTPEQIQGWLQLGLGGLMLAAMVLGFRKVWVFGWVMEAALAALRERLAEMTADRNQWRDMALRGVNAAEKASTVAEATIKNGKP